MFQKTYLLNVKSDVWILGVGKNILLHEIVFELLVDLDVSLKNGLVVAFKFMIYLTIIIKATSQLIWFFELALHQSLSTENLEGLEMVVT